MNNPESTYNWEIDHSDPNDENPTIIISVRPHKGLISKWKFIIPAEYIGIINWGISNKDKSSEINRPRGTIETPVIKLMDGQEVVLKGGTEPISSTKQATIILKSPAPHFLAFGFSEEEDSPPVNIEGITFEDHPH